MTKGSIPSDCVNYIPDSDMCKAMASHIHMYDSESCAAFP